MNWKPVSELKQIYKMFSETNWNEFPFGEFCLQWANFTEATFWDDPLLYMSQSYFMLGLWFE